jgi:hypothetical protein
VNEIPFRAFNPAVLLKRVLLLLEPVRLIPLLPRLPFAMLFDRLFQLDPERRIPFCVFLFAVFPVRLFQFDPVLKAIPFNVFPVAIFPERLLETEASRDIPLPVFPWTVFTDNVLLCEPVVSEIPF